ncbi:hypothetical protein NECID01_0629, partial [Nematocida sp. AWRm77]
MIARVLYYLWIILLGCVVLVYGSDFDSLGFELTDICADINLDNFYCDYSDLLDSLDGGSLLSALQAKKTLGCSSALDTPGPSNAMNAVDVNEGSSASAPVSLSLPGTSPSTSPGPSTGADAGSASFISSVHAQSPASSAKRACDTTKKKEGKQRARKRQKTTTTVAETNTALMDGEEARMAIENFNRRFGKHKKVMCRTPTGMPEFSKDLAQRGLTSVCSREIVEQCTASEHWLGHNMFWRMLMFFVDTLSLEIADSNRLEGKKTVVLRDRKLHKKPLSECSYKSMWNVISRYRDAERMEIQCSLNFLEGRSTVDVLCVLRWLLYHVKIEYVGIACDFTEPQITSEVLIRQIADLIKERRGSRVRIDSLALHFTLAQYMAAAGIVKKCPWITVLKIHFIDDDLYGDDDIEKALESLLPHCPALDQLSVFGIRIGIDHIQIITEILPQLVVLEVELLNLSMLTFGQKEKKKSNREAVPTEFPNISTLKVSDLYNYSGPGIKKFMGLFPNLKSIQILASFVTIPMIDALSRLRLLRSLEILNGTL